TGRLDKAAAGPFGVRVIDEDWHDAKRKRDVPVRIYLPQATRKDAADAKGHTEGDSAADRKYPVIVFSHGLWASRTTYGYFGQHMASHGYIVVAPTHAGSDTADLINAGRHRAGGPAADEKKSDSANDESGDTTDSTPPGGGRGALLIQRVSD